MEFSTELVIGGVVGAEKIKMASDLDWSSDDHHQAGKTPIFQRL
jgi:hypothetical protein